MAGGQDSFKPEMSQKDQNNAVLDVFDPQGSASNPPIPAEGAGQSGWQSSFKPDLTTTSSKESKVDFWHNAGTDEPGKIYGEILPFKKDIKTGEKSFAVPEALRSVARGIGDLYQSAEDKSTEVNPDMAGAMLSMIPATRLAPKAVSAAGKLVAPVGREIAEKSTELAAKAVPSIDEGLLPVVQLAQKYEIPVSLDEATGSRALKNIQKVGQDLPFSGQQAFREKQMRKWHKQILKTAGADSDRATPELMNQRFSSLGKEFDNLGKGKTFNLTGQFQKRIEEIKNEAGQIYSPAAVSNFEVAVEEVFAGTDLSGNISGERLNALRAKINARMRKTDNYETKSLLGDLEDSIIEVMTSGDPEVAKRFAKTKEQYKNLIVLEPLVQKGKAGNISPSKLKDRVARIYGRSYTKGQAGEIGELARIGYELLPELGGSDTVSKAAYGLGAFGGALSHPVLTFGALGLNRGFLDFINRNPNILREAIKQSLAKEAEKAGKSTAQ